jgi:glycosyltransferase involved in cell wall biosynthesis
MQVAFMLQPRDTLVAQAGSVTLVTTQLARELVAQGHRVSIYARRLPGQPAYEQSAEGIRLYRLRGEARHWQSILELGSGWFSAKLPWTMHDRYYPRLFRQVCAGVRDTQPDVIHVSTHVQYLPRLRLACPEACLAIHLHDEILLHLPPSWVASKLAVADLILCNRHAIRDRLRQQFPELRERICTLHHAADPQGFMPHRNSGADNPPTILFVGRLSPEKGAHVLAAAFRKVHQQLPHVRLKLVGPSGLMPFAWIRAVSADLHIASLQRFYGAGLFGRLYREFWQGGNGYLDVVRQELGPALQVTQFCAAVPFAEMPRVYQEASILVVPSVCNELPCSVWEAMAHGLPVILSYESDAEGVIENRKTAYRVRRNDPDDLAAAICHLLKNPETMQLLGDQARRAILTRGSWSHVAQELSTLYVRASVRDVRKEPGGSEV